MVEALYWKDGKGERSTVQRHCGRCRGVEYSINSDGSQEAKRRFRCRTYEFPERSCARLSRQLAYSFRLNARQAAKLTFVRVPIHFVLVRDVQHGGKHAVGGRATELRLVADVNQPCFAPDFRGR